MEIDSDKIKQNNSKKVPQEMGVREIKPNNSEKKHENDFCYDVMIVNDSNFTDDTNHNKNSNHNNIVNINNHNNHNNINNINNHNNTSILDIPQTKTDFIYYYLYDNGEKTGEDIIKEANISSIGSFNVLRNRTKNKIIVSRKEGTISFYDISKELREQIQFDINQRLKQEQKALEQKQEREDEQKIKQELEKTKTQRIFNLIENKDIFSFENGDVYLDLQELKESETDIFESLMQDPKRTLQEIEIGLEDKSFNYNFLRFKNLNAIQRITIDSLRSNHIEKFVSIECRVTTITDVRPKITSVKFECPSCGTIISVLQLTKKLKEPSRCSCGRRGGFKDISKDMEDVCIARFEDLKDLSDAPYLKSIKGIISNNLTKQEELKKFNPGNDVIIIGVLEEVKQHTYSGVELTTLDYQIKVLDVEEFEPEITPEDFEDEDIEKFKELSKEIDKNGLGRLLKSYAPTVEGYKTEKSALIIKGAQSRNLKNNKKIRTKSNYLFIGDPGGGKTVLTKFYNRITQGSTYISGSGSSAVGLTSSTEKTDDGWILKPGVLPLTKEDVIIDEFNLVNEDERPKLQEAMSESQITVNKASIHAKLSVQCGVTAIANPKNGVFIPEVTITKQFDITPQILNRFDTVFVLRDFVEHEKDERIAKIMIDRENNSIKPEYDESFLRKFFTYVRSRKEPLLSKKASEHIPKLYTNVRNNMDNNQQILVNPRFLESLIRMAKGYAKLRGSELIEIKDIKQTYEILSNTHLALKDINFEEDSSQ